MCHRTNAGLRPWECLYQQPGEVSGGKTTLMDKIPIFGRNEVAKHDCKGEIEHKLKLKELSLK
jgi:hypothetical protein